MLTDVEARALITGESILAFLDRDSVSEGDELAIASDRTVAPESVKPAYRRWIGTPLPEGDWTGVIEAVHPAALLDPTSGSSRHVLTDPGEGDLAIVRVYGPDGVAVLSDAAFAARVASIEGALNR